MAHQRRYGRKVTPPRQPAPFTNFVDFANCSTWEPQIDSEKFCVYDARVSGQTYMFSGYLIDLRRPYQQAGKWSGKVEITPSP
jgi:hypothetical protein